MLRRLYPLQGFKAFHIEQAKAFKRDLDCASIGTDVEHEEMTDALARRTNVTLLNAGAQVHHLMGERCGECPHSLRVSLEGGQHLPFRIYAHGRVGAGYRITVILRRKQRGLSKRLTSPSDVQHDLVPRAVNPRKPYATSDDLK